MKLPTHLSVDNISVPIIPVPTEELTDAHALYTTASGTPEIRHRKGLRGDFKLLSILHEWGHALLDMSEVSLDSETEEVVVGAIARNTLRLLKDVEKGKTSCPKQTST